MNAFTRHWDIAKAAIAHEKARTASAFRVEETDFLPAALEIVERPVSPTGRTTAWVLLVGLLLTIAWLALGKLDVVASAPGQLVPAENVKLVQPAETAVVHAILVHDGQRVRAGQPLIELDPTVSSADVQQAEKALQTASLDAARNRAIISALDGHGLHFIVPPDVPADVAETVRDLAKARVDQIEAAVASLAADRSAAASALAEARGQANKLTESLPLIDQQVKANEQLLAAGYVSKLRVIEMRRQQLGAVRDRSIALDAATKASAQLAVAKSNAVQNRAQARADLLQDLVRAEAEARQRREDLIKSRQRASLQRLLAPVDGTVAQINVHTVGGVVEAAKPIMRIVPLSGPMVMEAKLLNKDVGFVRVGQPVAIKLEPFPFSRFGTVRGRVQSISSDSVADEKLGLVYPLRIMLETRTIAGDRSSVPLAAGMAATADIRTGRRSILSYLLSPIEETTLQAGRER